MAQNYQLDQWFRYHAPTPETELKYRAIRDQERNCWISIQQAIYENVGTANLYDVINSECKAFATLIDNLAPDCQDKTAAIEHVRLARHAFNEAATPTKQAGDKNMVWLFTLGEQELVKARWKANSAIACGRV